MSLSAEKPHQQIAAGQSVPQLPVALARAFEGALPQVFELGDHHRKPAVPERPRVP